MNRYRAQVADALAAVTIHPSGSASWHGRRLARAPRGLPAPAARAFVVAALEQVLYESFYCPGAAVPWIEREQAPRQDVAFVDGLSAANTGRGCWAGGWRIDGRSGDDLLVSRNRLQLLAAPSQVRVEGPAVQIRLPKELPFASPGFYVALGDAGSLAGTADPLLRFYFHVAPAEAPDLMTALTSSLNATGIPFRLKVVDAPERFGRCDAAVLYVRATDFEGLRPVIGGVAAGIRLQEPTPAFTKPLCPGIGLAEQPGSGESFGGHRCNLLAEGIIQGHAAGTRHPDERLAVVERHFAANGIRLDAPYLEAESLDRYAL